MPHLPLPEQVQEIGAQWAASADDPTLSGSRTSTQWTAGRGFAGCGPNCSFHPHDAPPEDDTAAIASRVLGRLKLQGEPHAPSVLR